MNIRTKINLNFFSTFWHLNQIDGTSPSRDGGVGTNTEEIEECQNEWDWSRMMIPLSTSFMVWGHDSAPISHSEDHAEATHTESDSTSLNLYCTLLCLFVFTLINLVVVDPLHMLPALNIWAHWITGSGDVKQFPVCPTTEEKITHTAKAASFASFPPALSLLLLSYKESLLRPACSSDSPRELEL